MFFRKKKPKRLYYPTRSSWYTRPRRSSPAKRPSKFFKKGIKGFFKNLATKSLYLVITGIVFAVLLIFLFFSSYFSITNIEVVRESFNIDSAAIENELNPFIGKSIVFTPKSRIYKAIQKKFPEFAVIKVHKILPSALKINLESHPIVSNLKAYYVLPEAEEPEIDEEEFTELGKAIEELFDTDSDTSATESSDPFTDEEVTKSIFDIEGDEDEPEPIEQKCLLNRIGQAIFDQEENLELMTVSIRNLTQPIEDREQVISKEHMDYMLETIQHFTNVMGLEVIGTEYLPIAYEVHLKTSDNLVIWISIKRDYKKQIDKLHTIYDAAELYEEDLSYIDLRVREKVIYCPRNARCDQ